MDETVTVPKSDFDQLLAVATLYLDAFTDDDQTSYVESARVAEVAEVVERYGRRY